MRRRRPASEVTPPELRNGARGTHCFPEVGLPDGFVPPSAALVPSARKLRPGDQPLPVPNERPDIQSMVIEDITRRREIGIERYGTALQAHNGRDALRDAYEEALDLAMYLRQALEERDRPPAANGFLNGLNASSPAAETGLDRIAKAVRAARGGDAPPQIQGYA